MVTLGRISARSLELLVRAAEPLDDPIDAEGLREFAVQFDVEGAFAGVSWPD
jgi:hypothetical protein